MGSQEVRGEKSKEGEQHMQRHVAEKELKKQHDQKATKEAGRHSPSPSQDPREYYETANKKEFWGSVSEEIRNCLEFQ